MGNYIAQSLICVGVLTIGISTLSVSQNYSSTDEIEQRSVTKNSQQLCSNIPAGKTVARTELFFGLRKPNGTEVNNAEFQRFLVGEASPVENHEVTISEAFKYHQDWIDFSNGKPQ
jgi:hypothetical protein